MHVFLLCGNSGNYCNTVPSMVRFAINNIPIRLAVITKVHSNSVDGFAKERFRDLTRLCVAALNT